MHLLKAVPDWWLSAGQEIRIENLPTYFGTIGLTIRGTATGVRVKLNKPLRRPPSKIVLHLPANRPLETALDGVTTVTRKPQSVRWDFPTVIEHYRKLKGCENSPGGG